MASITSFTEQLHQFQALCQRPRGDRPAVVLIEGGARSDRSELANSVSNTAKKYCSIASIDFRNDFDGIEMGTDQATRNYVMERIISKLQQHPHQGKPLVVFLMHYEEAYKLDSKLRPFFSTTPHVVSWVLVSKRSLSASGPIHSGGYFIGYRHDDLYDSVIVMNFQKPKKPSIDRSPVARTSRSISALVASPDKAPSPEEIQAALWAREGQAEFRAKLLRVFHGRCAVTGCAVEPLLEAAHIVPYGEGRDHRLSNGLILRADIHTLFDKGLLAIVPKTEQTKGLVIIAQCLQSDPTYSVLEGKVDLPEEDAKERAEALLASFDRSLV